MPTSPLPSSSSMPGPKWPQKDCKVTIDETEDSASGECFNKIQDNSEKCGCQQYEETSCSFTEKRKLTVDIDKTRNYEYANEETKPFIEEKEPSSLNSECCSCSLNKKLDTEDSHGDRKTHSSKVMYCKSQCENCTRLNCERLNPCDRTTVDIPEKCDEVNNKLNRSKLKKKRRNFCCKLLLTGLIVVLLVVVASLVTYFVTNKPRENPNQIGNDPKNKDGIENHSHEPYMNKINSLFLSYMFKENGKHSKKLPGVFMNLDTNSLTDSDSLLKWKSSPKENLGKMENRDIEYSNGMFTVLRDCWYIIYSKLYLVTYKEYDESGEVNMNLHNYQHCVEFDVNPGDQKIDSICNMGSFWGGHKGVNQIWKPVFLKKGVAVKVTMKNKDIVSPDDLFSSFVMIELTHD